MVGILLISTRLYKKFVPPLLSQIDELFLSDYPKTIFLFTDQYQRGLPHLKNEVKQIIIPSYGYPYVTLFRYKIFTENSNQLSECSHLIYIDIDSAVVGEVNDEILVEGLMAVKHPGFAMNGGWGDVKNSEKSKSYLPKEKRKYYACGGIQGGSTKSFLKATKFMHEGIQEDLKIGVMPEWNDETFWNHELHTTEEKVSWFSPSYCMPEPIALRQKWHLEGFEPLVLALDKNHKEIRG